ncbi:MAG: hypothetical protein QW039_05695 [Fervidicoccaceae archaeon]
MGSDEKRYSIIELESMALGNKLSEAKLVNCEDSRKKMIVAIGRDGETFRTRCIEESKARRALISILNYIKWSRDIISSEQPTGIESW